MSVSLTAVSVANSIIFFSYPSIGILGVRSWSSELELENVFLGTDPTIANKIKGLKGPSPSFTAHPTILYLPDALVDALSIAASIANAKFEATQLSDASTLTYTLLRTKSKQLEHP